MAGTRLFAQLSFVVCVLAIFIGSMYHLGVHHYFGSHVKSLLSSHHSCRSVKDDNNFTSLDFYSNIPSLHDIVTEEEHDEFWSNVNNTVNSIENFLSPPVTELQVNLILASDADYTNNEEYQRRTKMIEKIAFSIETQLRSTRSLLPRIDIRIRDHPYPNFQVAVQQVSSFSDNQSSPVFTLSKWRLQQVINRRDGSGINIDSLRRSRLEPACVGACRALHVVMYHPKKEHQPLHLTSYTSASKAAIESTDKFSGLTVDNNLLIMAMNDDDFEAKVLHQSVQRAASTIVTNFLHPLVFNNIWLENNKLTTNDVSSRLSITECSMSTSVVDMNLKVMLVSRIIHFQRSISEVCKGVLALDEGGYYLHLQRDHPLFAVLVRALHEQNMAVACLESSSDNHLLATSEEIQKRRNMTSHERLLCAHNHLITSSQLIRQVYDSPELLDQVQEGREFLLAMIVPYWVPILIPVVFGTLVEVKRFRDHRRKSSLAAAVGGALA